LPFGKPARKEDEDVQVLLDRDQRSVVFPGNRAGERFWTRTFWVRISLTTTSWATWMLLRSSDARFRWGIGDRVRCLAAGPFFRRIIAMDDKMKVSGWRCDQETLGLRVLWEIGSVTWYITLHAAEQILAEHARFCDWQPGDPVVDQRDLTYWSKTDYGQYAQNDDSDIPDDLVLLMPVKDSVLAIHEDHQEELHRLIVQKLRTLLDEPCNLAEPVIPEIMSDPEVQADPEVLNEVQ
jgi:hypothetical protein